jgi:hypothetical protein
MMAGLLVALVIGLLFCGRQSSLFAARLSALTAIGIGFGGSMTYGQTVGLTHDPELVGNWSALRWGMLGLAIKGGIWIGFGGAFLGMGLSGRRYRALEMTTLLVVLLALLFAGLYFLNQPFDPANRVLPRIYFSDDWRWEREKADLLPRPERWGGLLVALGGLIAYLAIKGDRLARNMALVGVVSGGLGFPLGQSIQAAHAWNPEAFRAALGRLDPLVNWWNMMEITFGLVLGLGLALGVWLHRRSIPSLDLEGETELSPANEWALLAVHAAAIAVWEFLSFSAFDAVADHALTMGMMPLIAVAGGRLWPYMLSLPVLALPIAGKTLRQLSYNTEIVPVAPGWVCFVAIPMAITLAAALAFARLGEKRQTGRAFARWALVLATVLYFALNLAFFEVPWPFRPGAEATGRTPSALIFTVFGLTLIAAALVYGRGRRGASEAPADPFAPGG